MPCGGVLRANQYLDIPFDYPATVEHRRETREILEALRSVDESHLSWGLRCGLQAGARRSGTGTGWLVGHVQWLRSKVSGS